MVSPSLRVTGNATESSPNAIGKKQPEISLHILRNSTPQTMASSRNPRLGVKAASLWGQYNPTTRLRDAKVALTQLISQATAVRAGVSDKSRLIGYTPEALDELAEAKEQLARLVDEQKRICDDNTALEAAMLARVDGDTSQDPQAPLGLGDAEIEATRIRTVEQLFERTPEWLVQHPNAVELARKFSQKLPRSFAESDSGTTASRRKSAC